MDVRQRGNTNLTKPRHVSKTRPFRWRYRHNWWFSCIRRGKFCQNARQLAVQLSRHWSTLQSLSTLPVLPTRVTVCAMLLRPCGRAIAKLAEPTYQITLSATRESSLESSLVASNSPNAAYALLSVATLSTAQSWRVVPGDAHVMSVSAAKQWPATSGVSYLSFVICRHTCSVGSGLRQRSKSGSNHSHADGGPAVALRHASSPLATGSGLAPGSCCSYHIATAAALCCCCSVGGLQTCCDKGGHLG